ncbi:hypothetical protein [Microbacterium sp. cf046]|uniref:hypothetical protein n=1 Tax=Microbacterium sp. cf046 TaxID=1761803 RepID=UPI0015874E2C|nr:hypothetical protein [Microbacterium sp. cf046]
MSEPIVDDSEPAGDPALPPPRRRKRAWLWITIGAIVVPVILGAALALLVSNGTADAVPTPSAAQTTESPPVELALMF